MNQVISSFGHGWSYRSRLVEEIAGGVSGNGRVLGILSGVSEYPELWNPGVCVLLSLPCCSYHRAAIFTSNPLNSATNFEQYYFQPRSLFHVRVENLKIFAQDFSRFMTSLIHCAPLIFDFALTALTDYVCYEVGTEAISREIEGQIYA